MSPKSFFIGGLLAVLVLQVSAEDITVRRRRAETTATADELFGQRYIAGAKTRTRFYDEQTETGPPDEVIYRHGRSYVIELIFAADGTIARLTLLPEALLHTDNWSKVPDKLELSPSDMQWLVASANTLRPLGKAGRVGKAPDGCFQSGQNLYCTDTYALAIVSHYRVQRSYEKHLKNVAQKDVAVVYSQSIVGVVEDVKIEGSQRLLKVGGQWYHGEKPGVEIFSIAPIGSVVRLVSFGCAANEKACIATPEQENSVTILR